MTEIRSEPKARRPLVWIPWAVAAALALVAVTLGVRVNSLNREIRSEASELADLTVENAHAQEVLEVLTAPKAQHVVLTAGKADAGAKRASGLPGGAWRTDLAGEQHGTVAGGQGV